MMEFVPEKVGRAVVLNVMQGASAPQPNPLLPLASNAALDAFVGGDYVVGIHNWLIGTQLRYLIFDLQDEKEVPVDFLEELMQLMKRMRIPFLFAGVMDRPKAVLKSYAYTSKYPVFATVEEAIDWLVQKSPEVFGVAHDGIQFGAAIEMVRSRINGKPGEDGEESVSDADE